MKNLSLFLLMLGFCLSIATDRLVSQSWSLSGTQGSNVAGINYTGFPYIQPWLPGQSTFYQVFEIYGSGDYTKRVLSSQSPGPNSWPSTFSFNYTYPSLAQSYQPVSYFVSRKGDPPPGLVGNPLGTTGHTGSLGSSPYTQQPAWPSGATGKHVLLDTSYHIENGLTTAFAISYKPGKADAGKVYLFYNRKNSSASAGEFSVANEHKPYYSGARNRFSANYTNMPFANSVSYDYTNWEGLSSNSVLRHFVALNKQSADGPDFTFMAALTQDNSQNSSINPSYPQWALISPYLTNVGGTWHLEGKPLVDFTAFTMKSGRPIDPNKLTVKEVCTCGDDVQLTFQYEFCNEGTAKATVAHVEFSNMVEGLFSNFKFLRSTPSGSTSPEVRGEGFGPWSFSLIKLSPPLEPMVATGNDRARSCGSVAFSVCASRADIDRHGATLGGMIKGCTTFDSGEGGTVCVLNEKTPLLNEDMQKCQPVGNCCGSEPELPWWRQWWPWAFGLGFMGMGAYAYFKRRKKDPTE